MGLYPYFDFRTESEPGTEPEWFWPMPFPDQLLKQGSELPSKDHGSQAALKRANSTAYFALFNFLMSR